MNGFSWVTAVLIFMTYVLIDMLYAYSTSVIYSLLAYGVVSYSQNIFYILDARKPSPL